jgi:hypothetical protein
MISGFHVSIAVVASISQVNAFTVLLRVLAGLLVLLRHSWSLKTTVC